MFLKEVLLEIDGAIVGVCTGLEGGWIEGCGLMGGIG
jgi:hypothetical protein